MIMTSSILLPALQHTQTLTIRRSLGPSLEVILLAMGIPKNVCTALGAENMGTIKCTVMYLTMTATGKMSLEMVGVTLTRRLLRKLQFKKK